MKPFRSISLAGIALFSVVASAQQGPPITVVVDGNPVQFPDQQPQESNDRVLVPLRGVFEVLGAKVNWNPADQTITARKGDSRVRLAIGQLDASVDGRPVHMDVPATLVGGTTMVPLRFVSEALGAFVTWNAAAHEVDIRRSTDYHIPHEAPVRPPIIRRPPPQAVRRMDFAVIPAESVIPFALDTRLSSINARVGDQFTATLATAGEQHYFGLPAGTTAYGSVTYVRRRDSRYPGAIELGFDHLVMPNGRHIPVSGKLIGLDSGSVTHLRNGMIVARENERNEHAMFTGYGAGPGLVIGFSNNGAAAEIALSRRLQARLGMRPHVDQMRDVELGPGTQLGLVLYQNLNVPLR